jgi:hypothetical protein
MPLKEISRFSAAITAVQTGRSRTGEAALTKAARYALSVRSATPAMSAFPSKADMVRHDRDVRFVPKADVATSLDYFVGEAKQRDRKN